MGFHNALTYRQAQPGTVLWSFGRKKRIENALQHIRRDAFAIVRDAKPRI